MNRFFVKVEDESSPWKVANNTKEEKGMEEKKDIKLLPPTPVLAIAGNEKSTPNASVVYWLVVLLCTVWLSLLYFAVQNGLEFNTGCVAVAVVIITLLYSRISVDRVPVAENEKWVLTIVSILGCVFTGKQIVGNSDIANPMLPILFVMCSGVSLALTRVNAGLMSSKTVNSPFKFLRSVSRSQKWALVSVAMLGSTTCFIQFGYDHISTLLFGQLFCLARISIWYEDSVGFGSSFDGSDSDSKGSGITDVDGKTLHVKVVGYVVKDGMFSQYKVQVSHEGKTWVVCRRFSQFDSLRHELRRLFGHGVLPQLPKKTWFSKLSEEFLEERTLELDSFIQQLFAPSLKKQVFKISETRKFLGVGQGRKNVPETELNQKPIIRKATALELGEISGILAKAKGTFEKALSVGEGDGWKYLTKHLGCQCYLKTENGFTYTKGVGEFDYPPLVVAAFLADPSKRKGYDDMFKKDTIICEVDLATISKALGESEAVDVCDVKRVEFKSPFPLAITARDVVLASCRYIDVDGTVTVLMASPPDSYAKPDSKYVRARVFCAGVKIQPNPNKPGSSIMTNVQMMDPNGNIPGWIIKAVAPERCAMSAKMNDGIQAMSSPPTPLNVPPVPK